AGNYVGAVRTSSVLAGAPTFAIKAPAGIAFGPDHAMYAVGSFTYTRYGVARYVRAPKPKGKVPSPPAGTGKATAVKRPVTLTRDKLPVTIRCGKGVRCSGRVVVNEKRTAVTAPRKYAITPGKAKRIALTVT